jgi:hypothetical protein
MSSEEYVYPPLAVELVANRCRSQTEGNAAAAVADVPKSLPETKKRPRLDLSALDGGRERKRGKSMFGLVLGTLNKAKIEDKERNASEAVCPFILVLLPPLTHQSFGRQRNDN